MRRVMCITAVFQVLLLNAEMDSLQQKLAALVDHGGLGGEGAGNSPNFSCSCDSNTTFTFTYRGML